MAEDLLDLVRDCVQNQRQIKETNGKIYLGNKCFAKNAETTLPIKWLKGSSKNIKVRKFYNLGEICFFVEHRSLPHPEYVKKAQEKNIKYVQRPDRKPLLDCICPNSKRKLRSGSEKSKHKPATVSVHICANDQLLTCQSTVETEAENRKLQIDENTGARGRQKPCIRTYSRKRSNHELRPTSRRQSEDQCADMDSIGGDADLSDDLGLLKGENLNLERSLKSMESFLQDHLGVTSEQLKAIQECESNTVELSLIASHVKNNIVHADIFSNGDATSRTSYGNSKFCYKAIKHPVRGWEMTKQELSSVLLGYDGFKQSTEVEDHFSLSIEHCLAKGTALLKRTFSVLISQMREFNKPLVPQEESNVFFRKIVKDCLSDAVDSLRDMFIGLLKVQNTYNDAATLERWIDISRAELGKIFNSLAMTLQSLRDIPAMQQKAPTSLFHFPEPTFSLALNPAKVTHSVVLEMYLHIGLAELRKILFDILGREKEVHAIGFTSLSSNGSENHNHEKASIPQMDPESMHHQNSSFEGSLHSMPAPFPGNQSIFISSPQCQRTLKANSTDSEYQCTSTARHSILSEVIFQRNVSPRSQLNNSQRLSESDFCQYNTFKASLGNTLVSSFKKQIQEKIQASNVHPNESEKP